MSPPPPPIERPPLLVAHSLLDGMLDPVVAIDEYGKILMASRSVTKVFGYAPEELVGQNVRVLMPEPHHSAHDGYLQNYQRTGETHILNRTRDFEIVRKDGSVAEIELSVARVDLPDDAEPLFVGSFRDITERKRLQRAETSMLRALASLGRSAAVLAHEIKNPITSVNLALRAVADQLGADHEEVLTDLVERMQRLEKQLRESLSFAKPLELALARCRVSDLFSDVDVELQPMLQRDGVELELRVEPRDLTLRGDALRLEEVLTNLVHNAAEALVDGGRARLSACADGDDIVLQVDDDGPGVPPALSESIFDPFVSDKQRGTGLGLSISRRIIEAHGGTLQLMRNGELGGASFRIELPTGAAHLSTSSPEAQQP
ncbi:MAG: hypothetical protein DHS20C15_29730 [Planctomycetota bacterium]|nr:MAG: hypothetical protein DHS20C15_29730 [Planctomycetota bacterium]